jgi:hypothetical protein
MDVCLYKEIRCKKSLGNNAAKEGYLQQSPLRLLLPGLVQSGEQRTSRPGRTCGPGGRGATFGGEALSSCKGRAPQRPPGAEAERSTCPLPTPPCGGALAAFLVAWARWRRTVRLLRAWKIKVERQTSMQIEAIRIDNAAELKSLLKEWSDEYGLTHQPTAPCKSNQNGIAEKTIQRSESDARAMLIEAKLPIEFWDEAVEADTYLRNRLPRGEGLRTETYIFSPEAFTGPR